MARGGTRRSEVRIEGMDRFLHALGAVPSQYRKLNTAWRNESVKTIIQWAQSSPATGSQTLAQHDVRPGGIGEVIYGGKPYDMGAEFGAYTYKQFEPWRGSGDDAGYFLWPAVRKFRAQMMESLYEAKQQHIFNSICR